MANEFKIKKGLIVTGASGGTAVDVQGSQGQLFSVTDDLSGSIFAVSDISGVPILDVNSSGTVNVDGTLNINNKVVIQTGTTYAQATDYLYIGGDDLGSGDAAIYLGNRGDGTGYGWRFYYAGIGSGNNNNLVIRSENLVSPVDAVTFNQDGFANFGNKVRAANWFQGNGATNTLWSNVTAGVLLQTAGSTEDNNDSKIFFRNSGTTVKHTFNTHNGDATFVGQGFSAATSSGDASSTLTTKGYVDSLITGATIYRGAWDPSGGGYGSPDLSGVTQTSGYYYICSAAGTAEPNGTGTEPDTWETGDWVIYNDVSGTGQWQKIDNSSVLSGVGTGQTVALWEGAGSVTDSETLGNAPITVIGNDTAFAGNVTAYTGAGTGSLGVGRTSNQSIKLYVTDANNKITAEQDSDGDTAHKFILNRVFAGTGANDFIIQKDGTAQFTLDTSANATFAGGVTAPTFLGDLNGTINTATTGVTQTAGNNSTLIATTAYADAAATAVDPSGVYLPLTAGSGSSLTDNLYINDVDQNNVNRYGNFQSEVGFSRSPVTGDPNQWFKVVELNGSPKRIKFSIIATGDNTNSYDNFLISTSGYGMNMHIEKLPGGRYNTSKLLSVAVINPNNSGSVEIWIKLLPVYSGTGATYVACTSDVLASATILASATTTAPTLTSNDTQLDISGDNRNHATIQTSRGATFGDKIGIGTNAPAAMLTVAGDSTISGNVGIGTTSTSYALDVEAGGTGPALGDATTAAIFRAGRQNVWFQNQRTAAGTDWNNNTFKILAKIDTTSHQSIDFVNDASYNEHIDIYTGNQVFNTRFNANGDVGIGQPTPLNSLDVYRATGDASIRIQAETAAASTILKFRNNNADADITVDYTTSNQARMVFTTDNSSGYVPVLSLEANRDTLMYGKVGIGITNPVAALNIGNNGNIRIDGNASGGGIYASSNGSNNTFSLTRQDGVNVGDLSISGYSGVGITGGRSSSPAASGYSFYVKSNGNVGIGTDTPGSKLEVNGSIDAGGDGYLINGKAWAFESSDLLTLGDWDGQEFSTRIMDNNSSEVLRVTDGKVGIGTTSPRDTLEIVGNMRFVNGEDHLMIKPNSDTQGADFIVGDGIAATDTPVMSLNGLYGGQVTIQTQGNTVANKTVLDVQGTQGQLFSVTDDLSGDIFSVADISGVPIMNVNSSGLFTVDGTSYFNGNVGIGTTSPSALLEIEGDATTDDTPQLIVASGGADNNAIIHFSDDAGGQVSAIGALEGNILTFASHNELVFKTNTSSILGNNDTKMTIDTSGNVGIGTTSAAYKLVVNGVAASKRFYVPNVASSTAWALQARNSNSTADSGLYFENGDAQLLLRDDSNNLNVRINSDTNSYINGGNLGLGTTGPAQKLTINSGRMLVTNSTTPIYIKVNSGYKSWVHHISSDDGYIFAPSTVDGGETWDWANQTKLGANGVVRAKNFELSSDERFKDNVKDIKENRIKVAFKSFEIKSSPGEKRYGVIAQELEKNNPELVTTDTEGFKSVKYIDLLIAKIAELEARLEKLEK